MPLEDSAKTTIARGAKEAVPTPDVDRNDSLCNTKPNVLADP